MKRTPAEEAAHQGLMNRVLDTYLKGLGLSGFDDLTVARFLVTLQEMEFFAREELEKGAGSLSYAHSLSLYVREVKDEVEARKKKSKWRWW